MERATIERKIEARRVQTEAVNGQIAAIQAEQQAYNERVGRDLSNLYTELIRVEGGVRELEEMLKELPTPMPPEESPHAPTETGPPPPTPPPSEPPPPTSIAEARPRGKPVARVQSDAAPTPPVKPGKRGGKPRQ